jgi:hypothetical protein
MTCIVAVLAREERRWGEIFQNDDDCSGKQDAAAEAMDKCRYAASYLTPTSEEGLAFLAYVLAWYDGKDPKKHREEWLLRQRVSHTISCRYMHWGAAA